MSLECFTPQPAPFPKRRGWRAQKNEKTANGLPSNFPLSWRAATAVSQRKRLSRCSEKVPILAATARRVGSRLIPLTLGPHWTWRYLRLQHGSVSRKQTTRPPTACCKEWLSEERLHSIFNSFYLFDLIPISRKLFNTIDKEDMVAVMI